MTLRIIGMGARFGHGNSLHDFERAIYHGETPANTKDHDPAAAAREALQDAGSIHQQQVGLIHIGDMSLERLQEETSFSLHEVQALPVTDGAIFKAWHLAAAWLEDHPDQAALIVSGHEGGAGALLLESGLAAGRPAYARLESLTRHTSPARGCKDALDQSGLSPALVGYIEFLDPIQHDNYSPALDIGPVFSMNGEEPQTAIGSLASQFQDRTGILGVIKTALSIHRRTLYGFYAANDLQPTPALRNSSFYIPPQTRPWLEVHPEVSRVALVTGAIAGREKSGQLIVRETKPRRPLPQVRNDLQQQPTTLIPFSGRTREEILESLKHVEDHHEQGRSLSHTAAYAYANETDKGGWKGALLARNRDEFAQELQRLRKGIEKVIKNESSWSTPRGSYFTTRPLGKSGIAFVYPGAFNSYPGMGRDLFQIYPGMHEDIHTLTEDISHSLAETYLYPRNLTPLNKEQQNAHARRFFDHPVELIESGISLSVIHTLILKDIFGIKPRAAFGYSLGEISMLWANDIWQNASQSSDAWQNSPLFQDLLFGPKKAVRRHWDMKPPAANGDHDFWGSYILKAPRDAVQSAVQKRERVFSTILNAPGEVVIAGWDPHCQAVIEELGCHALPMPFDAVIHNPAMASTYQEFVALYTNEVQPEQGMRFYSAAEYAPLKLEKDHLARQIAKMTCEQVDFPRLVHSVYGSGPRIFIEVGPQKTCSRWIEKILEDQPHAVIPINKKYQGDAAGVLKVLSLLYSHQIELDLAPLYENYLPPQDMIRDRKAKPRQQESPSSIPGAPTPNRTPPVPAPQPPSTPQVPGNGTGDPAIEVYTRYYRDLSRHAARMAHSHQKFLTHQEHILQHIGQLMEMKAQALHQTSGVPSPVREPLYDEDDIQAFTLGDPQECFGPSYAMFEGRRIPRLPNGPFRFIDRVTAVEGESGKLEAGSWLMSEVDVPGSDWYFERQKGTLPMVALMEIALQPCGFLSAYLGSTFDKPETDFYFRNLDGAAQLDAWPQLAGNTIQNRVELLSTSRMGEIIIQKYAFQLQRNGRPFYSGETSFGYFTLSALKNQVGLDRGQRVLPWKEEHPSRGSWTSLSGVSAPDQEPFRPQVPDLNRLWASPSGGKHGKGYLYLTYPIAPGAWYFDAHFHQDPVMPGSLGVEIMSQALRKGSRILKIADSTRGHIHPGSDTTWRYRGQVTREAGHIQIEVHIRNIQDTARGVSITADGSLWNQDLRIYHVEGLTLEMVG